MTPAAATEYTAFSEHVKRLCRALGSLEPIAARLGVASPATTEWHELLMHKLLPQVDSEPFLVVATVGGTNIGKSVIFNHLAGELASAVSPLAAGTKHPVCLVPQGFSDRDELERLFEGFELVSWRSSDDPLSDVSANRLFWREGENVAPRLLLLDTPDIDSDVEVNWLRADAVRHVADVLIAVLTQQKYNDAAVKQFFRKAVEADKPIVIIFNQCDLADDRPVWPEWLRTFTAETGARPEYVYVVPYDRAAARERRLPFYDVGPTGREPPDAASSLREDLAALHFDAIKIRTFRGALARVLDGDRGAPSYLRAIRATSAQFRAAVDALSTAEMARVQWPSLPAEVLVDEIRHWWDVHRSDWSRRVHGFYRTVGRGVTWPIRTAWEAVSPPGPDPVAAFQRQERGAIVLAVEKLIDELDRLAQVGNDMLRPRLAALLTGDARRSLLERVQATHDQLPPVDDDYREFLRAELDAWGKENPRAIGFLRSLDHVTAVARPAITVSLAVSGWVLAGGLVHEAAVQAATHTATELATEAAVAGGITGGGEILLGTTGEGLRRAAARLFSRLQSRYAQQRAAWLASWLERELLGSTLAELRAGAELPQSAEFVAVEQAIEALGKPAIAQ
jgi:hypothetical protein